MHFQPIQARPNWRETAKQLGYLASVFDNPPYWIEALPEPFCAVFSEQEVGLIETASQHLIDLAWKAVDHICTSDQSEALLQRLKIPGAYHDAIRASWQRSDRTVYGRFDFSYSNDQLKLLEMNFDGAVSLYEASVFQWIWLEELKNAGQLPDNARQFNAIHEHLIGAFQALDLQSKTLHFASLDAPEEEETVRYLQSCALLAGVQGKFLHMKDLGYDGQGQLIDLRNQVITNLFKLYPWEMLFQEDAIIQESLGRSILQPLLAHNAVSFIEPIWKCLLSNKGVLAIIWQLEPDNPWLLKTFFEEDRQAQSLQQTAHVRKPIFGREGQNVAIVYPDKPEQTLVSPGNYGDEGFVVQELHPLPKHGRYHLLLGSWVVGKESVGLGLRADLSPITTATNCLFVPHYTQPAPT